MTRFLISAMLIGGALSLAAGAALAQETPRDRPSFSALDLDGNGELTPEELQARGAERFANVDTNDDGMLSRDELVAQAMERAERRADRMLDRLDADGDGMITQAEMQQTREGRGGRMFERADTDGSGTLSEAEFDAAAKTMRNRMGNRG